MSPINFSEQSCQQLKNKLLQHLRQVQIGLATTGM